MDNKDISKEELEKLYYHEEMTDRMIAEKYDVSINKIKSLRRKFNINIINKVLLDMTEDINDKYSALYVKLNEEAKQIILNRVNINRYAIALAHYFFRNGPIENMHAKGQLSQDDMKTLNKDMTNHIGTLLTLIADNDWLSIYSLYEVVFKNFGTDWDHFEIVSEDLETMNLCKANILKKGKEMFIEMKKGK